MILILKYNPRSSLLYYFALGVFSVKCFSVCTSLFILGYLVWGIQNALFLQVLWTSSVCLQCWGRPYWCIYYIEYCIGADEIWRCCWHVPNSENAQNAETCHGANRGMLLIKFTVLCIWGTCTWSFYVIWFITHPSPSPFFHNIMYFCLNERGKVGKLFLIFCRIQNFT